MLRMWRLVEIRAASADIKHFHYCANTKSWSSTSNVPFSRTIGTMMLGLVPKWSWRALLLFFQNSFCVGAVFRVGTLENAWHTTSKNSQIHNLIHLVFTTGLPKMLDNILKNQNFTSQKSKFRLPPTSIFETTPSRRTVQKWTNSGPFGVCSPHTRRSPSETRYWNSYSGLWRACSVGTGIYWSVLQRRVFELN